ncbi:hypothetical protein CSW30_10765, partial [Thermus scotoductus]
TQVLQALLNADREAFLREHGGRKNGYYPRKLETAFGQVELSIRHSAPLSLGLRILGWKPHPTYRCTTWATWAWWPASWIR